MSSIKKLILVLLLLAFLLGLVFIYFFLHKASAVVLGLIFALPSLFMVVGIVSSGEGNSQRTSKAIQGVANKLNLNFETQSRFGRLIPQVSIFGTLQGNEIEITIKGNNPIEEIRIKIACKNPEKRVLFISREKAKTMIGKLFDLPDIEIGDATFDNKFLIQSDLEEFPKDVFNEKLQKQLLRSQFIPMNTIALGVKEKSMKLNPSNKKESKDILDYELLFEEKKSKEINVQERKRNQVPTSYLRYGIRTGDFKSKLSLLHLEYMIDTMIVYANAINDHV